MKKLTYLSVMLVLASCASNPKSSFVKNEVVTIVLDKKENELGISSSFILTSILPNLIDWSSKKIKSEIEKEAKKYTAIYSSSKVDNSFYKTEKKETTFNYRGFKIIREILTKNKRDTVSQIDLKFIYSDNKKFISIKPDYLLIKKTKAKLKKNDDNLDLEVNIKINSSWVNKKQEYKNQETANITFTLKNIVLGKEYFESDKEISTNSDWIPLIPISLDRNGKVVGNGNFKITVTITEIDDYGERVKKFSTNIDSYKDILLELIKEKK